MKDTYIDNKGYERFNDSKKLVHRWIAYTHVYKKNKSDYPLPFSKYQVHHKDGNKKHNYSDHLELVEMEDHWNAHFPQFLKFKKQTLFLFAIIVILIGSAVFFILTQDSKEYTCQYDTYNCGDFKNKAEAQKVFELCGGVENDIHYLDGDDDGKPCESLP